MKKRRSEAPTGRWPSRQELLDWGMVPCAGNGCRVLMNPDLPRGPLCKGCWRRRRKGKR